VSVRVAKFHTSLAVSELPPVIEEIAASILFASWLPTVPTLVMVEVATFQTAAGSDARPDAKPDASDVEAASTVALVLVFMFEASEVEAPSTVALVLALMFDASDVEAVSTVAFVLLFTTAAIELDAVATCALVFALMLDASDVDAFSTAVSVLVFMLDASEVDAASMVALTPEVTPAVALFVFVLIFEASEVDAASTVAFVFPFTTAAIDDEAVAIALFVFAFTPVFPVVIAEATEDVAFSMSESVASDPLVSPAPVRVRVPFVQTSATSVPNPVSVRVPDAQTFAGIDAIEERIDVSEAPSDEEALVTIVLVFALMFEASEVDAVSTVLFVFAFMIDAMDELANSRSESVASEPTVSPGAVRVRVA
jgi:hypothetical protein